MLLRFIDLSLVDARAIGNFKVDPQSYSGDKLAAYIGWVSINKKRKKRKTVFYQPSFFYRSRVKSDLITTHCVNSHGFTKGTGRHSLRFNEMKCNLESTKDRIGKQQDRDSPSRSSNNPSIPTKLSEYS